MSINKVNKIDKSHKVEFYGYDKDDDFVCIKFENDDAQRILDFIKKEINHSDKTLLIKK